MKRFVSLFCALGAAAACGDNLSDHDDDQDHDAVQIDASPIDGMPTDAPTDAAVASHSGTVTVLEAQLLSPAGGGAFFGQGLQVGISFVDKTMLVAPTMEQSPGQPTGCKLIEFTPAQLAAQLGEDEGPVQITITGGAAQASFPACNFTAGVGYNCPDLTTAGAGGIIAPGAGPLAGAGILTDTNTTFTAANSAGRYIRIAGAATASNNGVFPIVAVGGALTANQVAYGNPGAAAETLPGAAQHVNIAGVGPIPDAPDPGFLLDDNAASVTHTMGGGNDVETFTQSTVSVGDQFALDSATLASLIAIPTTGTAADLTVQCATGSCPNGSSMGMLVNIISTDSAPQAGNPFDFPFPTTKRIQVRCAMIGGATSITIPAAYMDAFIGAGVTRIQATVIRTALLGLDPPSTTLVGHAVVGFTTP
jgi:hypothetical protein